MEKDTIISVKNSYNRIFYHIRFHLLMVFLIILQIIKKYNFKTKSNNIWLFKSDVELIVEDSIIVDNNITIPTKQIVIKGIINKSKQIRKWSLEKFKQKICINISV